jgi:hypothetical protein
LRPPKFFVEILDVVPLALERRGGAVQNAHETAEFTARIGRQNPRRETRTFGHNRDAADLGANAEFHQQQDAGEQQHRQQSQDGHILGQTLVRRRDGF